MKYKNTDEILMRFYSFIENDLYITTAGYTNFTHIKNPFKEFRMHKNFCLSIVINGEGILYVGKKKYTIKRGDIFFVPKEVKIKYYPKKKSDWEYFWFDFNGEKSEEYLNIIGFSNDNCVFEYNKINDIIYECEGLISKKFKGENVGYYEVLSAFYSIIDLIIKTKDSVTNTNIVESIMKYIKLHYSKQSLTIDEICSDFNISHSYLCKLFKNQSNMTAKRTIIKIRLEEAQKLLLNTNLSVKQIAYSVGFSDDAYFMKTFKKEFNITPSEYRKSNLK